MKIIIKEATLEHLKDLLNFNQQLFDYEYENFDKTLDCSWPPNNEGYFKENITKDDSLALVVFVDDKLVGYLIGVLTKPKNYKIFKKSAELDNMFLLPEARGKGIGTSLCKKFFEWAKSKGVERVRVIASAQNKRAIGCYRKNGFKDYDLILEKDL